uniref:PH domain-containing protein n=1 Tax=Glossina brevipalpis TaxID=37001 RepID=A0A1A9WBD8_9MUSC
MIPIKKEQVVVDCQIEMAEDTQQISDTTSTFQYCLNAEDSSSPLYDMEEKFSVTSAERGRNASSMRRQTCKPSPVLACSSNFQSKDEIAHQNCKTSYTSSISLSKLIVPNGESMKSFASAYSPITSNEVVMGEEHDTEKKKSLKRDSKVTNPLQSPCFQRRVGSILNVSYEFNEEQHRHLESKGDLKENPLNAGNEKIVVKQCDEEKKFNHLMENNKMIAVRQSLVSDKAALFENEIKQQIGKCHQNDPIELSVKERMKLFEKNKTKALAWKGGFDIIPSQVSRSDKEAQFQFVCATTNLPLIKGNVDKKVQAKVVALMLAANENKIKDNIRKQRQEDMQVLANGFKKKKIFYEIFEATFQQQKHEEDIIQETQLKAATLPSVTHNRDIKRGNVLQQSSPVSLPMSQNLILYSKRKSSDDGIKRTCQINQNLVRIDLMDFDSRKSHSDKERTNVNLSTPKTTDEMKETVEASNSKSKQQRNQLQQTESEDQEDMEFANCQDEISTTKGNGEDETLNVQHRNEKSPKAQKVKVKKVRYVDKDHCIENYRKADDSSEMSAGSDDCLSKSLDHQTNGDNGKPQGDEDGNDHDHDESGEAEDNTRLLGSSFGETNSPNFSFCKTPMVDSQIIDKKNNNSLGTTTSDGSESVANKETVNMLTPMRRVNSHRCEKNCTNSTPTHTLYGEQSMLMFNDSEYSDYSDDDLMQTEIGMDNSHLAQEKIDKLLNEVRKQQQIIDQTSQALRLCDVNFGFSGDMELVESERHLLAATHRYQACLDEMQRLRVEKIMRPMGAPHEKGRITVKQLTLPLRQSYVRQLALDTTPGHHLVCLLKYNEHVLATKSIPTLPGLLTVKFPDILRLNDVYADFKITIEIYGMTAQGNTLPHEVKYRKNSSKNSDIKNTKKKRLRNGSTMSPFQVVVVPKLIQYGVAIISLREIQKTNWTLTHSRSVSPLAGTLQMKLNYEMYVSVEHKGFLTIRGNISGLEDWQRCYCYLNGTVLSYWDYPDYAEDRTPIGSIDLYSATTQKVTIATRDICSRLNTILLECQRPRIEKEQETLAVVHHDEDRRAIVQYLMSADTIEECEAWRAYFNKALAVLRVWGLPPHHWSVLCASSSADDDDDDNDDDDDVGHDDDHDATPQPQPRLSYNLSRTLSHAPATASAALSATRQPQSRPSHSYAPATATPQPQP